jgi:hypothetical protein
MDGYNILIPSSCQQTSPELTLPIMDALQSLGHTPVVLDMASMAAMYQEMRYERHGCYEIFGFYSKDLIRQGKIDFGISVGLGLILEDPLKAEAHNLVEESGLPNVIYLHLRNSAVLGKLKEIGAENWRHTFFVSSCKSITDELRESGISLVETLAPGTSARIFYPLDQAPEDAAFSAKRDDEWATDGFDVSFVGSYSPLREKLLAALARAGIRLAIFGDAGWRQSKELMPFYRNQARYLQDVNTIYNHSRINLDLPYDDQQSPGYVSSRLFDCLASGSFMLTYGRPALADYFEPEHELATFETGHNGDAVILILQSVKYYLEQAVDRQALALRGHRRVMSRHLWRHRLEGLMPRLEMHLLQTAVH